MVLGINPKDLKVNQDEVAKHVAFLENLAKTRNSNVATAAYFGSLPQKMKYAVARNFCYPLGDTHKTFRAQLYEYKKTAVEKYYDQFLFLLDNEEDRTIRNKKIYALIDDAKSSGCLDVTNQENLSMLWLAVFTHDEELVQYLLESGASPNVFSQKFQSMLFLCVQEDLRMLAARLVEYGARIFVYDINDVGILKYSQMKGAIGVRNLLLSTEINMKIKALALQITSSEDEDALVKVKDAIAEVRDRYGMSAVRDLLNGVEDNATLIELCVFLEKTETLNFFLSEENLALLDKPSKYLDAGLIMASNNKNFSYVEQLIIAGANPNVKDEHGNTPLINAVRVGDLSSVVALIRLGADPDIGNNWGNTPLAWSVIREQPEIMDALLIANADKKLQNRSGDDPLSIALRNGKHGFVAGLVDDMRECKYSSLMIDLIMADDCSSVSIETPDLDKQNAGGFTALMVAAQKFVIAKSDAERDAIFSLIKQLLASCNDYTQENKEGYSFLSILSTSEYANSREILFELWDTIENNFGKTFFHNLMRQAPGMLLTMAGWCLDDEDDFIRFDKSINCLDGAGSSPLSYALLQTPRIDTPFSRRKVGDGICALVDFGARYIRNGRELLSPLHVKIMATQNSTYNFEKDVDYINYIDELDFYGRTPLHLVAMQGRFDLFEYMMSIGARNDTIDAYGRTPLHYAAMFGYQQLAQYSMSDESWLQQDSFGMPAIVYAMQHAFDDDEANKTLEKIKMLQTKDSSGVLDKFILYTSEKYSMGKRLGDRQALSLLSAARRYAELSTDRDLSAFDNMAMEIISDSTVFSSYTINLIERMALGLEFEVPELPFGTFVPVRDLVRWYDVNLVQDLTVNPSLLTPYYYEEGTKYEFVTKPISSNDSYEKAMSMVEDLFASGARVNLTSGLHAHFNVRGSKSIESPLEPFVEPDREFIFIKQLVINFMSIEPILVGFIRDGVLFDEYGSSYVETISKYRDQILKCKDLASLQVICSHNKTLDLTALDRHGTVEFRLHEGAIDPTIIHAWNDCLARLMIISQTQALENKKGQEFIPKPDIEQLVYILLANRSYAKTWSRELLSTSSMDMSPAARYSATESKTAQELIQESLLYTMFANIMDMNSAQVETYLRSDKFNEYFSALEPAEAKQLRCDLAQMVEFALDNPGLIPIEHLRLKKDIILSGIKMEKNRSNLPRS